MRRQLAGLMAIGLMVGAVLLAQQPATVVLKSGTRVSGDLVDFSARGFAMTVGGDDRQISKDDVASIEFGDGDVTRPSQLNDLGDGQQLALLRSGEVIVGEFYDISGRQPLRLTFKTSAGERVVTSNDVRRIYFSRDGASSSASDSTPTAPTNGTVRTFTVSSTVPWTATNISVQQGQHVWFEATGQVTTANGATGGAVGNGRSDRGSPIPSAQMGALIGRIVSGRGVAAIARGGSSVFLIGDQNSVEMPATGTLYLGVNDSGLRDNKGTFQVKVTIGQ